MLISLRLKPSVSLLPRLKLKLWLCLSYIMSNDIYKILMEFSKMVKESEKENE